ncbi:uncharacterized protein C3orf22 homolog [Erinaceus europaeus]|uniref:Uncharacterized protein C3orf22 homolog n=1 Tax=Erinaceus europaeus TaxID=9365 RepID=A0A1S2ZZA7_ERIEU|nr:uncharacterized protein C3orf22 homolog [Erinaceus europaeus]XP_060036198.1 uncharacterized protein C3orf22 homolog [Erinaceus europaeus]
MKRYATPTKYHPAWNKELVTSEAGGPQAERRSITKPPSTKKMRAPKKSHAWRNRTKAQEKFASTIPYRFSWLNEPSRERDPRKPRETCAVDSSLREQLPLRKALVPMRSIPVPGFGSPEFVPLSSLCPLPAPPLMSYFWEIRLLSRRFPLPGPSRRVS